MAGLVAIPGAVLSPAGVAGAVELPARTAPGTTGRLAMESLGTAGLEPLRTQVAAGGGGAALPGVCGAGGAGGNGFQGLIAIGYTPAVGGAGARSYGFIIG